ncbi:hypothetical protein GE061_018601 [Apolygus lucorum]|uniref:DUF7869 domain-containing protein n=1 Tax=Apolygus lucorum TaxID=248454 RepID=A0A6A4JD13_APOLU|nr:hypothetical protein GE061_018601 [Apolygus lucorum]
MSGSVCLTRNDLDRINKSRSRTLNIQEWKDVKRKNSRNSGQPYVSKKNKPVPGKLPSNCDQACSEFCIHCRSNITVEEKHENFRKFYELTYDEQSLFLLRLIRINEPTQRRSEKTDANSQRLCTFHFFIGDKRVCKKNFMDTFKISNKRIQNLQQKLKSGETSPRDQRGRYLNHPHAKLRIFRRLVIEHIKKFPRQESHYSRSTTTKMYLSPDLNLTKMYNSFKHDHPEATISKTLYRQIFKTFNLAFGQPRSDTCKQCDLLYIKLKAAGNDEERRAIQNESDLHHTKAVQGYGALKLDTSKAKQNPNIIVLCIDLQQVLFASTLHHSDVFYQRQLSCYNLAIHNMGTGRASMHLWYEVLAGRGASEISSCLMKYIELNFRPLADDEERKLIIWSDRCVGQNNNWTLLNTCCYLVQSRYFSEANQKFLVSGHSCLPCDRDFALIEKKKKTSKVYVPSQWKYVIADAKVNEPFSIVEMRQEDFKDL